VVSQSGGILGSLLSRAAARGIGLSKLISTSNEVDLELADFIDHLADDEATRVIALYVETVRNPQKFRAAALKAARAGKPVVASRSAARRPAPQPLCRTPARWPAPTACTTRCSARPA
jgi:acyl-CoA synthetase (NDP forming)